MASFNGNLIDEANQSNEQELNLLGERAIQSAQAQFLVPQNQWYPSENEEKPFDISYQTQVTEVDTSQIKPTKIAPTTSESMAITQQKMEQNLPKSQPSQIIPRKSFGNFVKANSETISNVSNIANNVFTGLAGERSEFSGARGDVAKGLDTAYDTIQNVAGKLGPYGKVVQAGMAVNKLVSNVVGKLGGGTDGMTTVDAIMGSPFMQMTPFGLVNGFGGKKADTITKNDEVFAQVGASYGGSNNTVDEALKKSGKKYGTFSSGARKEANQEIMEAKRQQNEIEDISNEATDLQDISNYMASINSDRLQFEMNGGYDQDSIRVGRVGFKMNKIHSIIQKAQKGTKLIDPYQYFLSTLPHNLQNEDKEYRMRELWEWNGKPKDFKSVQHLFHLVNGVFHAPSVSENPQGVLEFLKSPKHPSIHLEEEWYNSLEGAPFKERFELVKSEPYWKYVERTTPQKFQNGGAVNVIPEGALHARKNNMDIEGITKKGIPVVSEDGGKIQQHAEIERNEVILRLEVTQKIEELSKVYYSESSSEEEKEKAALEAGKLLSDEIINNTQDNTGLINDESRQK